MEPAATKMNARDAAIDRVIRRVQAFPDFEITQLDVSGLDPRDAALARAIDHAVARHWLTLAALIESRLKRPWNDVQADLRAILMTTAAQLYYLDRIPDHAATNHAVESAKARGHQRAAGFINGVVRNLIRLRGAETGQGLDRRDALPLPDGRWLSLNAPVFDIDPIARLAQQTSHPVHLVAHWVQHHGEQWTRDTCLHNLVHAPIILRLLADEVAQAPLVAHRVKGFGVFTGEHGSLGDLLDRSPELSVQDPTSALAVGLAGELNPKVIADMCAGRGTKTRQLADQHPQAVIVASDPDDQRRAGLERSFAAHDRVRIINPQRWAEHVGAVDLVVLDVPCSNTGVLARRVEARYRFSSRRQEQLVALQRQIIIDGLRLAAPGASLLYSTCSVDTEENEHQTRWIEKWHSYEQVMETTTTARGLPGGEACDYQDGGYASLLTRQAT